MNENSSYIFKYLGSAWDFLPKKQKEYFGTIWKSFEQIIAHGLQKNNEADLNISLSKCLPYTKDRWNKYLFNTQNKISTTAEFSVIININEKLDLSKKRYLGLKINKDEYHIDCAGINPFQTEYREIVYTINKNIGSNIVSIEERKNENYLIFRGNYITFIDSINSCSEILLRINTLPFDLECYPYKYAINDNIFSIPTLQNKLTNLKDNLILKEGKDYTVSKGILSSKHELPIEMWAKVSLVLDGTPYYNFGYLINLLEKGRNPDDYLLILRGIWAAYWQGSSPSSIKSSLSLLLGLPVAKQYSLILSIKNNIITAINPYDGEIDKYDIPKGLSPTVKVGQYVDKFTPLTSGVEIYDKVNYPNFLKDKISRSSLKKFIKKDYFEISEDEWDIIYEILATNTFLPQIDLQAFSNSKLSLTEINEFLMNIKSLNTMYFPEQILMGEFNDNILMSDYKMLNINIKPSINLDNINSFDSEHLYMDNDTILFSDSADFKIYKVGNK